MRGYWDDHNHHNARLPAIARPPDRTVRARLECVLRFGHSYDVIFVHRDAESETVDDRADEVREAVAAVLGKVPAVAVVPIRMTEAWILLDEFAIRAVAGRPSGTENLDLPSIRSVESVPDPKELLQSVLLRAGQPNGQRRRRNFIKRFPEHRRQLLERLDPGGPVTQLSAWHAMIKAVAETSQVLLKQSQASADADGNGNWAGA